MPVRTRRYVPTEQQQREVLLLAGYGIRQDEIATLLDIAPKTLRKAFRRQLDIGAIEANARVAQALYTNAVKNMNVAAQIWWTKCRMGWREPDPNTAGASHIVFSWRDEPAAAPALKPAREAPTIDAEPETGTELTVTWQGE
jgi:hypothetical protein